MADIQSKFGFGAKKDSDDIETPKELYELLNKEFEFDHDPCPLHGKDNPEVPNGLKSDWGKSNFVNPPFSKIKAFLKKAKKERKKGKKSVFLIPARTSSKYWHKHVFPHAREVRYFKGPLKFPGYVRGTPFPVSLVVFDPETKSKKDILEQNGQYSWTTIKNHPYVITEQKSDGTTVNYF
jgi:hypothetical protein